MLTPECDQPLVAVRSIEAVVSSVSAESSLLGREQVLLLLQPYPLVLTRLEEKSTTKVTKNEMNRASFSDFDVLPYSPLIARFPVMLSAHRFPGCLYLFFS